MLPNYALIEAIKHGSLTAFKEATERGASIDTKDLDGLSTLEVAQKYAQPEMARILCRLGADVNESIGRQGDSLIHRTARQGDIGFTSLLIECGADVNATNDHGKTPLHYAVSGGFQFLADALLAGGADHNQATPFGDTPLHIAARRGNRPIVSKLLKHGANASLTNHTKYTPLHEAAAAGKSEVVSLLIERGGYDKYAKRVLLPTVRRAAELHGHHETVAAIIADPAYQELPPPPTSRRR